MKICIIAEGSYPYTVGGVSSWIQMLVNSMTEHQFIIYAIGAQEKERGNFKYQLPDNIIEVREVFLDVILSEEGMPGKRYKINDDVREALKALILAQVVDWDCIFSYFLKNQHVKVTDFLMSRSFFDILQEVYKDRYSQTSFTDLFWTIRSMILPLLYVIKQDMPKADLYHCVSTGYAGVIGSLGKYLYHKPLLLTEHGIYTREREEEIIKSEWVKIYFKDTWIEYFYSLSKCAYNSADKVITLFSRNKEVEIELGCSKSKIDIVPNGIDVNSFKDIPQKESSDNFINIGAVVRVVPIKDLKTMLQGFAIASEKIPNIRLYIMGPLDEDTDYFEECKLFIESLELDNVIFTGNVNIKDYLGKMDILILTSISEGQPLAVLEGMACCKPFITSDVGSCKELLYGNGDSWGRAGIVVPVMDYERIGRAIVRLAKNERIRVIMGNNGFYRVSSLYTRERFISAYKNIYNRFEGL